MAGILFIRKPLIPAGSTGDPFRPFRLRLEDVPGTTQALYGHQPWLTALPNRTAQIKKSLKTSLGVNFKRFSGGFMNNAG